MTVALLSLTIAVPVALFVLWPIFRRRAEPLSEVGDGPAAALEAEKVLALRALRELELDHASGLLAEADYADLRARYEARAGAILERLDQLAPRVARAPVVMPPARPVPWTQRPLVLGGAGAALLLFGVALGMLVVRHSGPAPAEPPVEREAATPRPIPKAMLEGMLKAARASLDAGRYQEAIAAYQAVLRREPQNVDAITHLGVILARAGHTDAALEALDKALAIDPSYSLAHWNKARVLSEQREDPAGAIAAWERFVQVAPPGADRNEALARIREAKARLADGSRPAPPASVGKSSP